MIRILYFVRLVFCIFCVFFFRDHRKSLSEPGESYFESMSLVVHYTVSMFLNK